MRLEINTLLWIMDLSLKYTNFHELVVDFSRVLGQFLNISFCSKNDVISFGYDMDEDFLCIFYLVLLKSVLVSVQL